MLCINDWIVRIIFIFILVFSDTYAKNITYENSDAIFFNPERGFSAHTESSITLSFINSLKNQNVSIIHRIYTIPQFIDEPLSDDFLSMVELDMNTARKGGVKLVLRFSYTNNINGADAPLNIIKNHITQLKPLFQKHYDIIAYVEAGFIGAWGEWYYSTNDLNNTEDRRAVLFALLEALPVQRAVVVRTPEYKRKIFNDWNPLTLADAFSGSNKSRTGAHNDCFLASETDYGTYLSNDIEGDKDYLNQDNRFVPQGGETCSPSAYSDCAHALTDLARMHWSVLNKDYNETVLNSWENEGCMDEIKRRLGYRFRLLSASLSDSSKPGGKLTFSMDIANDGFASLYNPRNLELVLRDTLTGKKYRLVTNEDPRYWSSGDTVSIEIDCGLAEEMPDGDYQLYIHLADPIQPLHDRPEYSIRLANAGLWEDSTGYNSMRHIINVRKHYQNETYTGDLIFHPFKSSSSNPAEIEIDGQFNDWANHPQLDVSPDQEESGDALNDHVDLVDVWAADDADFLYISYLLSAAMGDEYFYHVFIDSDMDTSTGFHSAGSYAGIDYMVENASLWEYSGTNGAWGWTYKGKVGMQNGKEEKNRIELAIDRAIIEGTGQHESIGLLFNINDADDNFDDDYAPDAYKQRSYLYNFNVTGLPEKQFTQQPSNFELKIYPNPFNNRVTIQFNSQHSAIESAMIFNIQGKLIKNFSRSEISSINLVWDGKTDKDMEVSSGTYIFRLQTKNRIAVSKLIFLK